MLYVYARFAYMYVGVVCVCTTHSLEICIESPTTGVTDGCEPPCGGWESNQGPLQEQPVLSCPVILLSLASSPFFAFFLILQREKNRN